MTTDAPQPAPGDKPDIQIDGQTIKIGGDVVGRDKLESHSSRFEQANQTVQQQINVAGDYYQYGEQAPAVHPITVAERILREFKNAVLEERSEEALRVFLKIRRLQANLPELRSTVKSVENLYRLMVADIDTDLSDLIRRIPSDWANEIAAAFLLTYDRLHARSPDKMRAAIKHLPLDRITESKVRVRIESIPQSRLNLPPLRPPQPEFVVPSTSHPFSFDDAFEEQSVLFGNSSKEKRAAFWPAHLLLKPFATKRRSHLILGEHGSGRTALSLALGKYAVLNSLYLALYLSEVPDTSAIICGWARQFVSIIHNNAARLGLLSEEDLRLLAHLLCAGLDNLVVLAELKVFQSNLNLETDGGKIAETQINRLARQVSSVSPAITTLRAWPRAVVHLSKQFGYDADRTLLVIDNPVFDLEQIRRDLAPQINQWQNDGIQSFVFLPQPTNSQIESLSSVPVPHHQLTWTPDDFRAMIRYRYYNLMGPHHHIEREFDSDEAFEVLLACSGQNPRRFMQLWRTCEAARETERVFNADLVRKVCAGFKPV